MYVNVSGYKFVQLDNLDAIKSYFKANMLSTHVVGTIYIAHEGVNIAFSGLPEDVCQFKAFLEQDPRFSGIFFKDSYSEVRPFSKVVVKIKPEIIKLGVNDLDYNNAVNTHLEPEVLKTWLDEKKTVHLIDTRNYYEYNLGTFENAIDPKIHTFTEFPEFIDTLPEAYKEEPVVIFCTGGVRCEKAAPLMLQKGFKQVYQIHGGILNYFEKCQGAHWQGDCFVFDDRVAINPALEQVDVVLCENCDNGLTPAERELPEYIPHVQCHYCAKQTVAA